MNHAIYGLIAGHQQRKALGSLFQNAPLQGTADVDLSALEAKGLKALVFDFDGVLAAHAAPCPLDETKVVLQRALEIFGERNVYILSNKPSAERLAWFKQHLPGVEFIAGVRKKPYPDGLERVASQGPYAREEIALFDDRLLTGGLACLNAGTEFIYISKPYTNIHKHPVKELFFAFLRFTERGLARFAA